MSLLTIRTQIITEVGGRTDINNLIDDQINFAVKELASMYEFAELETTSTTITTSGQSEYLLPSDCYVLWGVKEETNRNKSLALKDIHLGYDNIDETKTGVPHNYCQWNKSLIIFGQVPDNNNGSNYLIRIRYWAKHANLNEDGDNIVLPDEWERGVRLKATAYTFGILDMEEKAATKQAEFDRWLSRIKPPRGAQKEKAKAAGMNFGSR